MNAWSGNRCRLKGCLWIQEAFSRLQQHTEQLNDNFEQLVTKVKLTLERLTFFLKDFWSKSKAKQLGWFLMNLTQNRVAFPNHNAGSIRGISHTTLYSTVYHGTPTPVLSHQTVLLPYLHCRQALLENVLLADVPFHPNITPWFQNTSCPFGHYHHHTKV